MWWKRGAVLLMCLLVPGAAAAATVTGTFQVQIQIQATCILVSSSNLTFATSGVLTANVDQTSTITVQCTNTTPYNVGLNAGANGGSVTTRQMKGGPTNQLINYSLSSDAARTVNWGQTIGTDTVAGTGNGSQQAYTVYGRVPPQTTPSPGTYTDTITVTVTY
ncbi:Spore coat protein U (SCPU) domain-containing protein [Rhizobiales bacterium GAS191]|nr:Spore coat protein U (SCPU) domain-containing protein [Rhizobiales bacterium GAS113]SEE96152.1 Spore coat protein U (SCPU) domain-containing protein [Rhizobiales bacterium GAS191]